MAQQFDFLRQYIEQVLDANDFGGLTEDTRAEFIPQFVAEAERRIGLAMLPLLTEDSATELTRLIQDPTVDAATLQRFWETNIPNFSQLLTATLENFAKEIKQTVANLA